MPPKKKDVAAQKAARDKKILAGLSVVFVVVFVVMVLPKLTAKHPGPAVANAAGDAVTTTTATTPAATPGVVAPVGPAPTATTFVAPQYSFANNEQQLSRYTGGLKTKDPFAGSQGATPAVTVEQPKIVLNPTTPASTTPSSGGGSTGGGDGSTSPTSTTPTAATPFLYAVISVNGLAEGVALKGPFPAASPMFTLTDIGATWVKFTLVTGRFTSGESKITLKKGHPVTLRNTADGSSFVLRLVAVSATVPTTTSTSPTSTDVSQTATSLTTPATTTSTTSPPPPTTPAG